MDGAVPVNRGRRLARLWFRVLKDLARSAPREHLDALRQDLVFTLRSARRAPGFTALVVLTFAVAIGANTSIFTVVHATLLRPLPFEEAGRLVRLVHVRDRPDGSVSEVGLSRRDYHAVAARAESFTGVAAQVYQGPALRTGTGIERVTSIGVSESWFRTMGVRPALGRGWTHAMEPTSDERQVVVLSDSVWRRHFAADPEIVGRTVMLDDDPHTVLGVMPPGFTYPYGADLWRSWQFDPDEGTSHILNVQARLAPGISLEEAQAELDLISERQAEAHPDTNRGYRIAARPTRTNVIGGEDRLLLLLGGGVGLVLLIAAVNVVGLLVVRTVSRSRELAVRTALGASTWRLTRQIVTENVVLALLGGTAGIALAVSLRGSMSALLPGGIQDLFGVVPFDFTIVGFGVGLSIVLGGVVGLFAARWVRSIDDRGVLHGDSEGWMGRRRILGATIVVETAMAVALLVGAFFLALDLHRLGTRDPGFETEDLVAATLSLPEDRYESGTTRLAFEREAVERIRALPGVEAAAIANLLPYADGNWSLPFELEGEPLPAEQAHAANFRQVTPGFFRTLGISVLRGRPLLQSDHANALSVAVVDQSFADRHFPGEDPVGQVIHAVRGSFDGRSFHVVGVVGKVEDPRREDSETVYAPMAQTSIDSTAFDIVQPSLALRSAGADPTAIIPAVRSVLEELDSGVPLFDVRTADEALGQSLAQRKVAAVLALVFGGCGLLLTAVGTYGTIAFVVRQRSRSFAVRMAVGAQSGDIFGGVLLLGSRLIGVGVGIGLLVTVGLSRVLSGSLHVIDLTNPTPYLVAVALLVAIGIGASLEPAIRATRTNPAKLLREL